MLKHLCTLIGAGMETPSSRLLPPAHWGGSCVSTFALCFAGQALWPAEAGSVRQDPGQIPTSSGSAAPSPRAAAPANAGPLPAGSAAHHQRGGAEPHAGAGGRVPQAGRCRGKAAEGPGEKSQENRQLGRLGRWPQGGWRFDAHLSSVLAASTACVFLRHHLCDEPAADLPKLCQLLTRRS